MGAWQGGDETVESCTLLTTEPNELVRAVGHPRMPVMLTSEAEYARWLNPELTGREAFEPLFAPFDPARWSHMRPRGAPNARLRRGRLSGRGS